MTLAFGASKLPALGDSADKLGHRGMERLATDERLACSYGIATSLSTSFCRGCIDAYCITS
jgi:hypothetical protein